MRPISLMKVRWSFEHRDSVKFNAILVIRFLWKMALNFPLSCTFTLYILRFTFKIYLIFNIQRLHWKQLIRCTLHLYAEKKIKLKNKNKYETNSQEHIPKSVKTSISNQLWERVVCMSNVDNGPKERVNEWMSLRHKAPQQQKHR